MIPKWRLREIHDFAHTGGENMELQKARGIIRELLNERAALLEHYAYDMGCAENGWSGREEEADETLVRRIIQSRKEVEFMRKLNGKSR